MAKSATYELSDAEKRDLIELIQAGKPLPERYRFLLFEDKREVEIVWNGKTRDVCTTVLPFQSLEHVDEPRREADEKRDPQFDLFDSRGRQMKGWTNKLIWGDNRLILSSLKSGPLREEIEQAGGLKLIYIDPPFDIGADFSMDIEIGGETFHKEPNLLEQIAYRDTWGHGADSFISMIYERLILMRDLLHAQGSIYVHCDYRVASFIKLALDEIFGADCFVNDVIWHYQTSSGLSSKKFIKNHDIIFFYARRAGEHHFNDIKIPWPEATLRKWQKDEDGRIYRVQNKFGKRYYIDPAGKSIDDVWDITLTSRSHERIGYPTQKPEELIERIVLASSNPGELVADFFVGSGTTAAVAEKLGRRWIASDLGKFAIHTTRKRMINVQRELKATGNDFRAFEVLNLGRYERQAYLHVGGRLTREQREEALARKEREFRDLILKAYKAELLKEASFFHGKTVGRLVIVGPINLPVGRLFVEEIIVECRKRGVTRVDLLAFEFEMGLFPAVLDEAKQKGIDLTPKYIPAEVFDRRAVEKGQVVFFDVAFIEATPRYGNKKGDLSVAIELTDFSVFYNQGQAEDLIKSLKEGKNGIALDKGQLVKVSKYKNGIVTREVLTKKWTDWIDYWAVDFNYESRKEIIRKPKDFGLEPAIELAEPGATPIVEYEEVWTGSYLFENEWQSFRTRKNRDLELVSVAHTYDRPGRYSAAVKVIDIFGNDTMTLLPITVG